MAKGDKGDKGDRKKSDMLSDEQLRALRAEAETHRAAIDEFCEAAGVLWNSRLDMAIASRDGGTLERTLRLPPLKLWDDCNCGCGPVIVLSW
ncbi:MAG: hypothetical protein ABJI96_23410 [Paracoccaceae bacterium]